MNGTPQPVQPSDRRRGLLGCLLVTVLATRLPPLAGLLMNLATDPHGPLGRLYTGT